MEVFVLACLIATAPETRDQRELVAMCDQVYSEEAACLEHAAKLKRAFDYAENRRSEGTLAGCIRKPLAGLQLPSNHEKGEM
jgi:hypothetical protein